MTRIREARVNAGLSQKEVALTLGVRAPSVWAWESGKSKPTAKNLEALSVLYGVSVDFLLGHEAEKNAASSGGLREETAAAMADLSSEELRQVILYAEFLKSSRKSP